MNPEGDLLRLLAGMPFPDRLEMVALSGWSRGAVYKVAAALEGGGPGGVRAPRLGARRPHAPLLP